MGNLVKHITFLIERIIEARYNGQKYAQILQLRYIMDCTYREIGQRLGLSYQAIKLVDDYVKERLKIEISHVKSIKVSYEVEQDLQILKTKLPPMLNARRLMSYFIDLIDAEDVGNHFLILLLSLIDYHLIYIGRQKYYVAEGLAEQAQKCYEIVEEVVKRLKREASSAVDLDLICQEFQQERGLLAVLLDNHPSLVKVADGQYKLNERITRSSDYRLEQCYAILAQSNRPLHTNTILQSMQLPHSFYGRLHELIVCDPQQRFQLIGKTGYIALRQWGICAKSIKESIIDILKEAESGLSVRQIVYKLKERKRIPISVNTVNTTITNNKQLFQRYRKKVFLSGKPVLLDPVHHRSGF